MASPVQTTPSTVADKKLIIVMLTKEKFLMLAEVYKSITKIGKEIIVASIVEKVAISNGE